MSFPTELQELLDEGRAVVRSLIKFEFGTGTYGIWNGTGTLPYGGVDYIPNRLVTVEMGAFALGTQAVPMTIRMIEDKDAGITPNSLASIEDEDYKNRPVTLYDAFFHPDTQALLHVEPLHGQYADYLDHVIEQGKAAIIGHLEGRAIDNHREGYRTASHADQQLISAGDMFFEHAGKVRTDYFDIKFES
jgi:hypothetical protein